MNFKLGPFENRRTFYSPSGNQTVIKDVIQNQVDPAQPEEPKIEIIMSGEPSLDILKENPTPKNTKKKNERHSEN